MTFPLYVATTTNPGLDALEKIQADSPFKFHLTGSRFLGLSSFSSDYDYFCGVEDHDKDQLIGILEANGFVKANKYGLPPAPTHKAQFASFSPPPPYDKANCTIMQWKPGMFDLGHNKVDVLISNPVDIKNRLDTFNALKTIVGKNFAAMTNVHTLSKGNSDLWTVLYQLYAKGREDGALAADCAPVNSVPDGFIDNDLPF